MTHLIKERYTLLDQLLQKRWLIHTIFWLGVLSAAPLFAEFTDLTRFQSFIFRAVGLPLKMAAAYLLVYYQIPKLLQRKKYFQALLSFAISTVVFTILYRINNVYIAETLAGSTQPRESILQILSEYKFTIGGYFWRVYLFPFFFLFLKIIKDWALERQQIEVLLKEKASAELNFLKAQIHPHFLFNTLNNLYALAVKKSDDTADGIAKLSEMLDYMLYQCNEPKVLVSKEVEHIQNYIDLELLRYGTRLSLNFDHEIDDPNARITPLVLPSIVENAFKHGVSGAINQPIVDISLIVQNQKLHLKVFNTKPEIKSEDPKNYKMGIGITNIKRQLELVYPNRYEWLIDERSNSYEVNLNINL